MQTRCLTTARKILHFSSRIAIANPSNNKRTRGRSTSNNMVLSMRFGGTTCTTQSRYPSTHCVIANTARRSLVITTVCHRPVRLKATVTALVSASVDNQKLTFRQATSKDSANISKMVIKERCYKCGPIHWVRFLSDLLFHHHKLLPSCSDL